MMKRRSILSVGLLATMFMASQQGCSSHQSAGGSGGSPAAGGKMGSGGAGESGGTTASGGATAGHGGAAGGQSGGAGGGGAGGVSASGGSSAPAGTGGTTAVGGRDGGAGQTGTGGSGQDAATGAGGLTSGTGGAGSGGATLTGGNTGRGGTGAGGSTGTGGATQAGGATGGPDGGNLSGVVSCPDLPGATRSPLYSVTANGTALFVEKMTKFSPEMQVHYAHASLVGGNPVTIAVTVGESFSAYKLSPKSRKLAATKSGNTVTFTTGPNYLIFQPDAKELLFVLLDAEEASPPQLGDANVKNLADYDVDNTGATLVTSKIQSAINAASGATQSILYVPPGRYKVGELWLKSNMTMYLACGAILYGSSATADFNTGSGGINIEGMQHSLIRIYQAKNTKLLGRGVLDANGKAIRAAGLNASLMKIEQSSNITIDGVLVRDSSYWNTLIYRSDLVNIYNYKMINCRPNVDWNNTDGVDFDESTNGTLYNAFLYTGDDSMATKNEEASGTVNTKNILHEKVVCYSNSVACKVGTKTMGQSMDNVVWKDIDVVKAGRALTLEGYDSAVVQNTRFEDIRVEAADVFIKLALDEPPDWRTAANTTVYRNTYFTNVSSDSNRSIVLRGRSGSSGTINGVHFKNLTIQGKAVTSQTDPDASWNIANGVTNITFE
jgi:3D (Asp-Asp-Asp) domain-containing protein